MSKIYSPKIVTDSLVMCLDASQNKSYPTTDLPVKGGLVMWMDASDDTTFSYSSGTTVSQWRDKSGFNYHMVPISAGPTRSSSLNSRKVLTFTTSQTIGSLSFTMETSANTVFVVSRYTSSSLNTNRVLTAYYNNWLLGHWGSQFNKYYAEGWVYGATDPADTVWRMYMGDWSGSSTDLANFYSNGTALATGSTAASAGPKGLGINYQSGEPSACEAAEIIVFNRVLTTTERRLVHTYLGQKWGIFNTDRCVFDLSGNGFDFVFNGANPRYNAKTFVSNFNTTSPFAVSSYGGQNLTSNILNLLYSDHTIEVAFNAKGFRSVYSYDNTLTTQDGQSIVIWTGRHSGLRVYQNTIIYEYWNTQSSTVGISVSISSYIDKIIYITATRTGDVLRLYINGVLLSGPTTVAATTSPVSYSQINIGAAYQGNPTTQGYIWAGQHEYHLLRMYGRRLSDSEVASNYQAFKARFDNNIVRFGLVMELDAGNPYSYAGAGTTWYDVSGNSNSGTLTNGPTYNSDAGGNIVFDGSNDYVSIPSAASIKNTSNLSLEGWVFISSAMSYYGGIIGKGISDSQEEYCLLVNSANSKVYMDVGAGGGPYTDATYSFSLNTWYHIIGTHERVAGSSTIKIYVNGSLLSSTTVNPTSAVNDNTTNVSIGSRYDGGTSVWNGKIATARIYTRTLSAAEVLQNYNATKGRFGL
jgi:hypothetical protein